jgi:hypothetical protein
MKKLDKLNDLLYSDDGLLISLRMGDGLNKEKFSEVCEILKELATEWAGKDEISKYGAHLLFELYPALIGGSGFYGKEEQVQIEDATNQIYNLIVNCLG